MNCDGIAIKGFLAWEPNRRATEMEALHFHDIPLIGTFEQGDCTVLFSCLTGAAARTSIWAYTPLGEAEVTDLEAFDCESTEELETYTHSLFSGREVVFASVAEGRINRWTPLQVADDEMVLSAAVRFMNGLIAETEGRISSSERKRDEAARRLKQAEQARADATRQVLEPA